MENFLNGLGTRLQIVELHTPGLDSRRDCHAVVIASDGLWDECTFDECASLCRKSPTAAATADALLRKACKDKVDLDMPAGERTKEKMHDDTTVVVVDLNPAGREVPPLGGGGCCAIQ